MTMKQSMKLKAAKKQSYEIAALLLLAVLIIPNSVSAQPSGSPPSGNVDASFNTVTVGPGTFDFLVQPGGGSNTEFTTGGNLLFDLNNGLGTLFFQNSGGSTTLSINSSGIWDTSKPVTIVDDIDIQNGIVNTTGPVEVIDDDGLEIADGVGTVGLTIAADGDIVDASGSVIIDDSLDVNSGMRVNDTIQVGIDPTYSTIYGQLIHNGGGTGFKLNANAGGGSWADMLFQTNGVTRMFLEYNGNFGIGTTAPQYKLHVSDRMKLDGATAGMWVEAGVNDWFVGRTSGSNFRFYNAGDRMTITPAGHVTATGGFGTYTTAFQSGNVSPGSSYYRVAYCPSGYQAVSCGMITGMPSSQNPDVFASTLSPWSTYCQARGRNESPYTYNVQIYVRCYNSAV